MACQFHVPSDCEIGRYPKFRLMVNIKVNILLSHWEGSEFAKQQLEPLQTLNQCRIGFLTRHNQLGRHHVCGVFREKAHLVAHVAVKVGHELLEVEGTDEPVRVDSPENEYILLVVYVGLVAHFELVLEQPGPGEYALVDVGLVGVGPVLVGQLLLGHKFRIL